MNTIFLRIYGGIIASLVLVALLGVGALQLTNEVRSDQYREQLARGTFRRWRTTWLRWRSWTGAAPWPPGAA